MTTAHHPAALRPHSPLGQRTSRGLVTLGTLALVAMALLVGYVVVRGAATVQEFFLVESLVKKIAQSAPATDTDVREAFERQRGIDGIEALRGSDLAIQRQAGGLVISFSYDKVVPLFGPVSLLIEYRGSSRGS